MGRQSGDTFKEGTVDGLIYYKTEHGYLVRSKGNLDKARVTEDPAFEGSRKASVEFGRAAVASRIIRHAVKESCPYALNSKTHYRLNSVFNGIIKKDITSSLGDRKVLAEHLHPLKEFLWNENFPLSRVMWAQIKGSTGDDGRLTITMPGFVAKRDLAWPMAATHAEVTVLAMGIDFENGKGNHSAAKSGLLPKAALATDLVLQCEPVVITNEVMVAGIGVGFYQQVDGQMVELKDESGFGIVG